MKDIGTYPHYASRAASIPGVLALMFQMMAEVRGFPGMGVLTWIPLSCRPQ